MTGHQYLVPGLNVGQPIAVGNQIQAFGSIPGENDHPAALCIQECPNSLTRIFIGLCCSNTQRIQSPEGGGVLLFVNFF